MYRDSEQGSDCVCGYATSYGRDVDLSERYFGGSYRTPQLLELSGAFIIYLDSTLLTSDQESAIALMFWEIR
jgi:hypothetical protein